MPNKNKTGPEGKGPKTGRGLGQCGDGVARGEGRGKGLGLGLRKNVEKDNESKDEEN